MFYGLSICNNSCETTVSEQKLTLYRDVHKVESGMTNEVMNWWEWDIDGQKMLEIKMWHNCSDFNGILNAFELAVCTQSPSPWRCNEWAKIEEHGQY